MTTLIIQAIEKANYLATEADIEKLAAANFESSKLQQYAHGAYFRILLAATQQALMGKVLLRPARGPQPEISDDERKAHVEAFELVNSKIYAAVLRGSITPDVEHKESLPVEEQRTRSLARNRRNNFARTAASTLRKFIKHGGDVRRLVVPTATKSAVAGMTNNTEGRPNDTDEDRARRKLERAGERFATLAESVAAADKAVAIRVLQASATRVTDLLVKYVGRPTTKPEESVAQHRALKTPQGLFWPMTQH
jgi:hypothetical protein